MEFFVGSTEGLLSTGYPKASKAVMKTLAFVNKTLAATSVVNRTESHQTVRGRDAASATADGTVIVTRREEGVDVLKNRFSRVHAKFTAKVSMVRDDCVAHIFGQTGGVDHITS